MLNPHFFAKNGIPPPRDVASGNDIVSVCSQRRGTDNAIVESQPASL
jgi:hypothetical protein